MESLHLTFESGFWHSAKGLALPPRDPLSAQRRFEALDHGWFVHSPSEEHLSYFQFLPIVKTGAVNARVQVLGEGKVSLLQSTGWRYCATCKDESDSTRTASPHSRQGHVSPGCSAPLSALGVAGVFILTI